MKKIFIITLCAASSMVLFTSGCSCRNSGGNPASAAETVSAENSPASDVTAEPAYQEKLGTIEFDKTVHNFGDVMLSDGPLSCTFTLKNTGEKPSVIYNVVTSCGCTDVKWTQEPILGGKTGTISVTYSNDEGPYPFDKAITAYISGVDRPVILRLRGISHDRKLSLEEMYPIKVGNTLGIKALDLKCGNIEQGGRRSDEVNIANLSDRPVEVSFTGVSDFLSLQVSPNPIPARQTARLVFTVTADKSIYGKNLYYATPVADGKKTDSRLSVYAFTKENFSGMTEAERRSGPRPIFTTNTFSAGKIKAGTVVDAEFVFSNAGASDLKIYKIDVDNAQASAIPAAPVKPGTKGSVKVKLDTSGLPEGEMLVTCTLTTNSPARPIINLFIAGWIE